MSSLPSEHTELHVPLVEEQLCVDTRVVYTGRGVRIHKTVSEQPVTVAETLLRDELRVTHVPIDRLVGVDEAPANRQEGDTLIIPVLEEVLVVERRLRIREELHITRVKREENFEQTFSLKKEDIDIEYFDEAGRQPAP